MNPTYFTIFPIFMGLATMKLNPKNRFLLISPFLTVAILKKYKTNAKKITNRMLFFGKMFFISYFCINQIKDVLSIPSIILLLITFYKSTPFEEKIYQQFCFCSWLILMAFSQIVSSKEVKNVLGIFLKEKNIIES